MYTPCLRGICVDLINDYRCDCYGGFTGDNCEINIDECLGEGGREGLKYSGHICVFIIFGE